jgi:seryl-tRNA synthetase
VLDLKFIRRHPELVRAGAKKKRIACDIDLIVRLDEEARARGVELDRLRAEQNVLGAQVAKAPADEKKELLARLAQIKAQHSALEGAQREQEAELAKLLLRVPNVPAEAVPEGKDDSENVVIKHWGEVRKFDFPARDHVALAEAQGWLDIERAARLSGSRNYVLKGDLSLLEGAVMRFALDMMVERGFTPLSVPTLVRTDIMVGTGYFPGGEDQAYRCDERDDSASTGSCIATGCPTGSPRSSTSR